MLQIVTHLIQFRELNPLDQGPQGQKEGIGLYWSESRVYSPDLREWLSVDPMVKMNPKKMVGMPGNWKATEYASGDPVNLVDTTGYAGVSGAIYGSFSGGIGSYISSGVDGMELQLEL